MQVANESSAYLFKLTGLRTGSSQSELHLKGGGLDRNVVPLGCGMRGGPAPAEEDGGADVMGVISLDGESSSGCFSWGCMVEG